jgi:hypothetical protein
MLHKITSISPSLWRIPLWWTPPLPPLPPQITENKIVKKLRRQHSKNDQDVSCERKNWLWCQSVAEMSACYIITLTPTPPPPPPKEFPCVENSLLAPEIAVKFKLRCQLRWRMRKYWDVSLPSMTKMLVVKEKNWLWYKSDTENQHVTYSTHDYPFPPPWMIPILIVPDSSL